MDATRRISRVAAACAALMLVGAADAAASTLSYDGNVSPRTIAYVDAAGEIDRVEVRLGEDNTMAPAFEFVPLPFATATLAGGNGCGTDNDPVAGGVACNDEGQRIVFQLGGGADLVDLRPLGANAIPSDALGGAGNDELRGSAAADVFDGGTENDVMVGLLGADRFAGGPGDDRLDLSGGASPMVVSLDGNPNDGPQGGGAVAGVNADVEAIDGSPQSDILSGADGAQTIRGGGGADTITGGPGQDSLEGEGGDDVVATRDGFADDVSCGAGADDRVTADWNDIVDPDCDVVDRSVRDDDGDGSANGVDCNDANATIRPGAGDIPGNGVDEDCDGADGAVDRDGDGSVLGVDCDDADARRRPGAVDVPANGIDEDCSGADAARPRVAGTVSTEWSVFRRWTVIRKLTVAGASAGASLQVRCSGRGCPFERRSVRLRGGAARLTPAFKGRRLRPGAVVELRLTAPGAIGRVQRITIRRRKAPKRVTLCLAPGAARAAKCA